MVAAGLRGCLNPVNSCERMLAIQGREPMFKRTDELSQARACRIPLCSVAALALLCVAGTASAANDKVYSGAACVPEQGHKVANVIYPFGAVQNVGSAPATVNCAIVRDNTTNTDGLATVKVRLWNGRQFLDSNALAFGCGVWAFSKFRTPEDFNQGAGFQKLFAKSYSTIQRDLNSGIVTELVFDNIDTSFAQGEYVLFCQLPPKTAVVSYLVSEH